MRLGLLGPAGDAPHVLEAAARFLMEDLAVERVVYLGVDGALDRLVECWAADLVGDNPTEAGIWSRAVRTCAEANAEQIDAFIESERSRRRLRIFESLPDAETRAVEMLGGALAVMTYDKANLTEEDMLPAKLLLIGKEKKAMVKQVGPRWFLAPGPLGTAGLMTLEDRDDVVGLTLFDHSGNELQHEQLLVGRAIRLTVSGAGP